MSNKVTVEQVLEVSGYKLTEKNIKTAYEILERLKKEFPNYSEEFLIEEQLYCDLNDK